jgi:hypothetical protein
MAAWAANHSNYNTVVAYGSYEGGMNGYNDTTAAGAVAAFLIIRGQHWLFSIGVSGVSELEGGRGGGVGVGLAFLDRRK